MGKKIFFRIKSYFMLIFFQKIILVMTGLVFFSLTILSCGALIYATANDPHSGQALAFHPGSWSLLNICIGIIYISTYSEKNSINTGEIIGILMMHFPGFCLSAFLFIIYSRVILSNFEVNNSNFTDIFFIGVIISWFIGLNTIIWSNIIRASKKEKDFITFLLVLLFIAIMIFSFSLGYIAFGLSGNIQKSNSPSFREALYFSIITWTGVGYGDIIPINNSRLLAAAEAIIGYISMAVMAFLLFRSLTRSTRSNKRKKSLGS